MGGRGEKLPDDSEQSLKYHLGGIMSTVIIIIKKTLFMKNWVQLCLHESLLSVTSMLSITATGLAPHHHKQETKSPISHQPNVMICDVICDDLNGILPQYKNFKDR